MKITDSIRLLPEKLQPKQPLAFDEIFSLSVQADTEGVKKLALRIRHHLDVNADFEESQLPLQHISNETRKSKQNLVVQNALKEHSSSHLA